MADSNTILPAELQHLAIQQKESNQNSNELGQDDFLELMLTQLKHQDPLNPAESSEFIAQMAQFATVTGITDLNNSFATLSGSLQSSTALQASTMVGATVLVPSTKAELDAGGQISGKVYLENSTTNLALNILDSSGQTVKQISLGSNEAGLVKYTWDGTDNAGNALPAGKYTVEATATVDGEAVAQTVLVNAKVESVSLASGNEAQLNLGGLGKYSMNDVLEIM